jgi:hypothetical protein
MHSQRCLSLILAVALGQSGGGLISRAEAATVIFSTIADSQTSDVPGHPGQKFRFQGFLGLVEPAASPDGSRWSIGGLVTDPLPEADSQWLVVGSGLTAASAQVVVIPGQTPVPGDPSRVYQLLNLTRMSINKSGQFAFQAVTDEPFDSDDLIARWNGSTFEVVAREGRPSPLTDVPYGFLSAAHILENGNVSFLHSDQQRRILYGNVDLSTGTVIAETGTTVPAGQLSPPHQSLATISLHNVHFDGTGGHHIYSARLHGPDLTSQVVVVDGHVVAQAGHPVPGFVNTAPLLEVPELNSVQMSSFNGHWMFRGAVDDGTPSRHSTDFVSHTGTIVAATRWPIVTGSTEVWDDSGDFKRTFYMNLVNSHGDYVISGVSGTGDHVLVYNGTEVLLRQGDPIDLDGNGLFDDGTYLGLLSSARGFLTDNGQLYFTAHLQDAQGFLLGQAFMALVVPEPSTMVQLPLVSLLLLGRARSMRRSET